MSKREPMALNEGQQRTDRRAFLLAAGSLVGLAALGRGGILGLGDLRAATGPTLETREVPLHGTRSLLSGDAPPRFDLVGLHWRGSGTVSLRTRDLEGRWRPWVGGADSHLPDPTSSEAKRLEGWRLGAPVWTDAAAAIEYRREGRVEALRAHFVSSPSAPLGRRAAIAEQPAIVSRADWGARESIVREAPVLAEQLSLAIIHHTAGTRPTAPAQSAAVLRAIQLYHVQANGWNDIGYNFLVDPFGQVFEGRGGGIEANVVGAHALGFNTGSVGIALLGNLDRQRLSGSERQALAELVSWRLDVAHLDPLQPASFAGKSLRLPTSVVGHGDVNSTDCPGKNVRLFLPDLATTGAAIGLPKLYDPLLEGALGEPIRFSARLSQELPWTVTVTDSQGALVGQGSGSGSTVDWTWPGGSGEGGPYAWTIEAGPGLRPASGSLALEAPQVPRPERPAGIPRRIPPWAWEMYAWHSLPPRTRGPRPSRAPRRLPRWYWRWRKWRLELERWSAQHSS